jgi:hypothetical protein
MEDLQLTQTEPVQLRQSKRIHQRAQQGAYIEEIPMSLFGLLLEHDFCLVAYEIKEDNILVHPTNISIQNSDQGNKITEIMVQNSSLITDNEKNKWRRTYIQ